MLNNVFINGIQKVDYITHTNLSNLSICQFKYLIYKKTSIPINDQILKFAGKLLSDNKFFFDYPNIINGSTIDLNIRLMGGSTNKHKKNKKNKKQKISKKEDFINIGKISGAVKKNLDKTFGGSINKIANFFTGDVANFFTLIGDVIEWLFYLVIWLVTDLLNPLVWINDVILGAFVGLKLLFAGILDGFFSLIKELFNKIFQPVAKGVWGNEFSDHSQSKCFKAPTCSVPYPILFATIILPPLGVFMELGLKGWLNILLCAVLTLIYYLPGLIYALILLYC